jgi:hypothetical protein
MVKFGLLLVGGHIIEPHCLMICGYIVTQIYRSNSRCPRKILGGGQGVSGRSVLGIHCRKVEMRVLLVLHMCSVINTQPMVKKMRTYQPCRNMPE